MAAIVPLEPETRVPTKGGSNNVSVPLEYIELNNASNPEAIAPALRFAASTDTNEEEHALWHFDVPDDYNGTGDLTVRIKWKASVTTGNVDMEVKFIARDHDDASTRDWDTATAANLAAGDVGTAEDVIEDTITVTNANADGCGTGDRMTMCLRRDANDATNDTCTGICEVLGVRVEFPTS